MDTILAFGISLFTLILGFIIAKLIYDKKLRILYEENNQIKERAIKTNTELNYNEKHLQELKGENHKLIEKNEELVKIEASVIAEKLSLQKRVDEQREEIASIQEKFKAQVNSLEEKIGHKFENLAHKIFDNTTNKFKTESKASLEGILTPLKENIDQFKKEFNAKYLAESKDRVRLETEIKNLTGLGQTLSKEANNLSSALSGSVKAQGNWGEIILERVLKHSGLKEGVDFIREGTGLGLKNEYGASQRPDVIVNLPDDKHLIIDSKVTLNSYTRYVASNDEETRTQALQQFILALKNHINGLASKNYELLEKLITPEYVMMFMPIEGALSLALEKDPSLFEYAWERRVILLGPTNLLATLKAVESVWRQDKQEKNALKIAELGGKLYDKFKNFTDDMKDIEKYIQKTDEAYTHAFKKLSTGSGNLIGQAEKMKKLGAKAKKSLPRDLLETSIN